MPEKYKFPVIIFVTFFLLSLYPDQTAVRFGTIGDFETLNPIVSSSPDVVNFSYLIHETLLSQDSQTGKISLNLLEDISWSDDNQILTMRLKEDIMTHEGQILKASDVAYTLKKYAETKVSLNLLPFVNNLKSIDIIDDFTLRITMKQPLGSIWYYLHLFPVIPRDSATSSGLKNCGTGPYQIHSIEDNIFHLRKFENYHNGCPDIDNVEILQLENSSRIWSALIKNEINLTSKLIPGDYIHIAENPDFACHQTPSPMCYMIVFNMKNGLFANSQLRKALNYAVNKQNLIDQCLSGVGIPARSPVYPGSWGYDPESEGYPWDPQKAVNILEELGWQDLDEDCIREKDGQKLSFKVLIDKGDAQKKEAIQYIMLNLSEIGVRIKPVFMERKRLISERLMKRDFDAIFIQVTTEDPDVTELFWHSEQIKNGFNCFSYSNPEVDEHLEKGRVTFDLAERKKYYKKFQTAFMNDPPGILLFYPKRTFVYRNIFNIPYEDYYEAIRNIHQWDINKN